MRAKAIAVIAAGVGFSSIVLFAGSTRAHVMSIPVANNSFEASSSQPFVADGELTTTIADWATVAPSLVVRNPTSAEFASAAGNGTLPTPAEGSQALYNTSTSDDGWLTGTALSIPATWQDGTPIGNGTGGLQHGITYTIMVAIGEALDSPPFSVVVDLHTPGFGYGAIHYSDSYFLVPDPNSGSFIRRHPTGDFEDFAVTCNFDAFLDSGGVNVGDSISTAIMLQPGAYVDNVRLTISDVPEPCSLVLLGIGVAGLFAYAWRWRRKAA
jgi:hypothetical protein